jgi:hypothetical protein
LLDGISLVAARGGLGLFVAIQEMSGGPIAGIGGNEPALAGAGNLYENTRNYLMWALSAKREKFGLREAEWEDSAALTATAGAAMKGWARDFPDRSGSRIRRRSRACRSALRFRSHPGAPGASLFLATRSIR